MNDMKENTLDPKNESHWMTHAEHEARRDRPKAESSIWNEWAAKNPTLGARALAGLDLVAKMEQSVRGTLKGARAVDNR